MCHKNKTAQRYNEELTSKVKELAKSKGAELVGIAPVKRFKNAPLTLSPQGLLPTAKSVVVVGIYFLDASMELMEKEWRLHEFDLYGQNQSGTGMNNRLDSIGFHLARFIENYGYKSLPISASNVWKFRPDKNIDHPFAPDLVHRYAAVAAGLGEIGWSGLFLSPQYGPRQRLNSVVTEAPLEPTPMYSGPPLCDKCMECVKNCPVDAFRKGVKKINKLEIGRKIFKFPDINKWRCIWASFDMLVPPLPEKANEKVFLELLAKYGNRGGDTGNCIYVCVPPHLRYKDKNYSRTYRRKRQITKISSSKITEKAREKVLEAGIDYLAIGSPDDFTKKNIDLRQYLPDVRSIVVIGMHFSDNLTRDASSYRLTRLVFDLTHLFQDLGYSSLGKTLFPEHLAAVTLGLATFEKSVDLARLEKGG